MLQPTDDTDLANVEREGMGWAGSSWYRMEVIPAPSAKCVCFILTVSDRFRLLVNPRGIIVAVERRIEGTKVVKKVAIARSSPSSSVVLGRGLRRGPDHNIPHTCRGNRPCQNGKNQGHRVGEGAIGVQRGVGSAIGPRHAIEPLSYHYRSRCCRGRARLAMIRLQAEVGRRVGGQEVEESGGLHRARNCVEQKGVGDVLGDFSLCASSWFSASQVRLQFSCLGTLGRGISRGIHFRTDFLRRVCTLFTSPLFPLPSRCGGSDITKAQSRLVFPGDRESAKDDGGAGIESNGYATVGGDADGVLEVQGFTSGKTLLVRTSRNLRGDGCERSLSWKWAWALWYVREKENRRLVRKEVRCHRPSWAREPFTSLSKERF